MVWRMQSVLWQSDARTTSSAETTMLLSEQPSSIHSSAVARHIVSMFANGLKISSKESRQKKTLTNYYLVTGRHYPLIAGNSCYYQQLAATNGYYLLVAANCYLYVLGRMFTKKFTVGVGISPTQSPKRLSQTVTAGGEFHSAPKIYKTILLFLLYFVKYILLNFKVCL